MGTLEERFVVNIWLKDADVNVGLQLCFIDYEKYSSIEYDTNKGIDAKIVNIMQTLYWNQTAAIRIEEEISNKYYVLRLYIDGAAVA